jgi:quinoprotein glucose dehydrogenase
VSKIEGPLATLTLPAAIGGTNWPGGSFDPETHTLYVGSQTLVSPMGLVPPSDPKIDLDYVQGSAITGMRGGGGSGADAGADAPAPAPAPNPGAGEGGGQLLTVQGLPLVKPPYGRISAIDLDKGEIRWQIANGETPDVVRNHPALEGREIPCTGQRGHVGTLVTKTLLVAGESGFTTTSSGRGAMLRAYDKATGKEVGAVYMPAPQSGSPMTYMFNGRQYIVIAVSGGNYPGELIAFTLAR